MLTVLCDVHSFNGGKGMQERGSRLESQVNVLFTDVPANKSNDATKQDVESRGVKVESINSDLYEAIMIQTKWLVAMQFMTLGLGLFLAKLLF
jgi:hypothetical protein